jgi:hypothetical protein
MKHRLTKSCDSSEGGYEHEMLTLVWCIDALASGRFGWNVDVISRGR